MTESVCSSQVSKVLQFLAELFWSCSLVRSALHPGLAHWHLLVTKACWVTFVFGSFPTVQTRDGSSLTLLFMC